MKPVHKRRLLKLADIMDKVKRKEFHLDKKGWGAKSSECGTICCVLGHASLDKGFRRAGLIGAICLEKLLQNRGAIPIDIVNQELGNDIIREACTFDNGFMDGKKGRERNIHKDNPRLGWVYELGHELGKNS